MRTHVTLKGAFAIAQAEGIVPTRYVDDVGVDTVYIGHTAAAGNPDPRTMSFDMPTDHKLYQSIREAWDLFQEDLVAYEQPIIALLGDGLKPHELDGWTMWNYNTGGIHSTSAVRKWLAGDKVGAVATLQQWNKVTKKGVKQTAPYLVRRRALEAAIILRGEYPGGTIPVWPTNGKGRVIWSTVEQISMESLKVMLGKAGTVNYVNAYPSVDDRRTKGDWVSRLVAAITALFTRRVQ